MVINAKEQTRLINNHKDYRAQSGFCNRIFLVEGLLLQRRAEMERYVCTICGYVYDPAAGDLENGIDPGTPFSGLPENWVCPICGAGKDVFEPA